MKNGFKILVVKTEERDYLEGPGVDWDDNIKTGLKEKGMRMWSEFIWLKMRTNSGLLEHNNEPWDSVEGG
jgi:hypothetical protein